MWSPTHIQVTVQRAKGLLVKGKNGTNNCFVMIVLGKEKYQTSVKEKAASDIDWHEECELTIPEHGNRAELILTCLHRNSLQMDAFLGQVVLPLNEMDVYERPKSKWFKLQSKDKDKKHKDRGELEVRITFTVKAGSLSDLSKKEKKGSTLGLGGSLLSIGTLEKRKSLKKFAKSLGSKMHISSKPKKNKEKEIDTESISDSISNISTPGSGSFQPRHFGQIAGDADPGVISEDDDEFVFDNLSHKSSASSLNVKPNILPKPPSPAIPIANDERENVQLRAKTLPPSKPPRITSDPPQNIDEWESKLYGKHLDIGSSDSLKRRSWESSRVPISTSTSKEIEVPKYQEHVLASTAPTTPNLEDQKKTENVEKPKALPRSATLESIVEKDKDIKDEYVEKKEKAEKRFSKLKYFRKEKTASIEDLRQKFSQKQFGERIIIGHENNYKDLEISPDLIKKYDGKSREEIMVIANDLETEVKVQKLKMKEMEDYLDNLLLRVMETQPKLLQNPYRTQSSVKSG